MNSSPASEDRFSSAIRAELSRRQASSRWLADYIGVSDATLRTWLARQRFPESAALRICQCFGWKFEDPEHLKREYGIKEWARPRYVDGGESSTHLLDAFEMLDRRRHHANKTFEKMNQDLVDLYAAMGSNDLFVFLASTVTPAEFENFRGQTLRTAIASAIYRGSIFLYLRPEQSVLNCFLGDPWRLERITKREDEFDYEIESFQSALVDVFARKHSDVSRHDAEKLVHERVMQYKVRESLFWAPGFSLGMFQSRKPASSDPVRRMTVQFPGGHGGIWYLPDCGLFAHRFCTCIDVALHEQETRLSAGKPARERHGTEHEQLRLLRGRLFGHERPQAE